MMGPVECSSIGDTDYFRNLDFEFLQSYRMPNYGDTCLSIAASDGQLEVCKVLYERCPQHLFSVNSFQNTIFHHVAFYRNSTSIMCDYFIHLLWKSAGHIETEFGFKQWLQRKNKNGETAFYRSLKSEHITEMIKYWIQVDRTYNLDLLPIPNKEGNTPLHKVTELQNIENVELLLTAKPDYVYGTNNDGELPLSIAMRLALSSGNSISADIRRLILERQPDQSKIGIGEKQWTALHHAAHICDVAGIADIVRFCPSCMEIVDANGQNYLQIAFQSGNLYRVMHVLKMNNIVVQTPLSLIDDKNNTLMHLAVEQKEFELVKWLMPGESDIGYGPNIYGDTPLLIAMRQALSSENNEDKIISAKTRKYLLQMNPGQSMICTGSKSWTALQHAVHSGDIVSVKDIFNLCPNSMSLTDVEGRNFLHTAVSLGQIDVFMHTLKTCNIERELLNQLDIYGKTPLGMTDNNKNTPLHLAVKYEEFEVVKQLSDASLNIPFGINIDGETPLSIATRQALSPDNVISVEIRKLLLEKHPKQSEILTGENRWTSLHYGASIGDIGVVEDILRWCPNCVELLDNEGRNFLHLAAEYKQYIVVKHVCEANDISPTILNQNDNYGNTPLHTAAQTGNRDIILCLLYKPEVDKTTSNARGQRVLDAITFDYDKERAGVFGVRDRMNDKELKDQSDFDLVVGALIATVSFTSGIMVPGGYISDGPDSGMALLSKQASFEVFAIANSFGLVFSLYAVFSHFCTRHLLKREDIIYQLNVAMLCTLAAIFSMMVAFIAGSYAVLAVSNRIAIIVCVNSGCFFIFAFRAILRILSQHKKSTLWRYFGFSSTHSVSEKRKMWN